MVRSLTTDPFNETMLKTSCVGFVQTINNMSLICRKLSKGMCQYYSAGSEGANGKTTDDIT